MGRATRYELVSAATVGELSAKVNEMIVEGWEPHGPPITHGGQLVQAVLRTDTGGKRIRKTSED